MEKLSKIKWYLRQVKEMKCILHRLTNLWMQDVNGNYPDSIKIRTKIVDGLFHFNQFDVVIKNGDSKKFVSVELGIYDDNADIARKYFNQLFD